MVDAAAATHGPVMHRLGAVPVGVEQEAPVVVVAVALSAASLY
jgi:hypothetical protein